MIRLLLNENIPLASAKLLREAGFDVVSILEDSPGISDRKIMERANQEGRIVVTFDRDYGELIYRRHLPAPSGVLYLRFTPLAPEEPAEYVLCLLKDKNISLASRFTVADRAQIRQRPL